MGGSRVLHSALLALTMGLGLTACGEDPPEPAAVRTEIPESVADTAPPPPQVASDAAQIGTPLAERVATIGLLNKRNNVSQELEMAPGDSRRVGDVIVRLRSCEKTAPWELPQETGAFVQVLVADRSGENQFRRIFSGWLFKNSPSLNVVEHPVYDVFVKDCAMSFPEGGGGSDAADAPDALEEAAEPAPTA
ncbi:hypothetical protein GCM10022600_07930 [Qipengyuania pelagi]|jgi:hypothetical protein|nr:DUF2155 domain-containing protein [Qipengyuania pelagi]